MPDRAGYKDEDLVFATVAGGVLHPDNITGTFDRLVKASGLPRIRLHDLRHSAVTLLLEERVPLKVVSERLGHSSIAITGDLYQRVTEHMQEEAAAAVGRVLSASRNLSPDSRHHFGTTSAPGRSRPRARRPKIGHG